MWHKYILNKKNEKLTRDTYSTVLVSYQKKINCYSFTKMWT